MSDFFSFIFEQGMIIIVGLGAVLAILILAYKKTPSPTGLPQNLRVPQPSGSVATAQNQVILPEQQRSKEEAFFEKIINNANFEIESTKPIKAFGAEYNIKTRKINPITPFKPLSKEEIALLDENDEKTMDEYLKDVKPSHKEAEGENVDEPEAPEKGWEELLENNGVKHDGDAQK